MRRGEVVQQIHVVLGLLLPLNLLPLLELAVGELQQRLEALREKVHAQQKTIGAHEHQRLHEHRSLENGLNVDVRLITLAVDKMLILMGIGEASGGVLHLVPHQPNVTDKLCCRSPRNSNCIAAVQRMDTLSAAIVIGLYFFRGLGSCRQ